MDAMDKLKIPAEFTAAQKMEVNAMSQVYVWILNNKEEGSVMQREIAEYQRLVGARYGSKARQCQLYQVLVGGTPVAGGYYDFPDEEYSVRKFYDTIRQRVGSATQGPAA